MSRIILFPAACQPQAPRRTTSRYFFFSPFSPFSPLSLFSALGLASASAPSSPSTSFLPFLMTSGSAGVAASAATGSPGLSFFPFPFLPALLEAPRLGRRCRFRRHGFHGLLFFHLQRHDVRQHALRLGDQLHLGGIERQFTCTQLCIQH